ncbi:MAG: immunity protein TriTu family protein [Janthinobacterium lividum]
MGNGPLAKLISGRGFDQFQGGLRSRFGTYGLWYKLTYCEPTDNSAMRLDFESRIHIERVTVWESGECDLEVLEIANGATVFAEHHKVENEQEFHRVYPHLTEYMRDALGWP